ncbi:hypothetical protein HYPSUDRAFT_39482 [Hypholoma sublateritium FD-334 SS-4]|uniref:Xylanolytic transcriptional activator regulatory domain-containing protein n=1 Tax=Hypholoma sublateritium (strain FD-334 SS-4) TaxID=945553 RepID=A0A0D2MJS3_HYPSF|nr:hypothetical protein HYPSUDRAFT_39482 [Hypholoma sublateritium FD-334 SS-4]
MHKRAEALQMRYLEWRRYAEHLESALEKCAHDYHQQPLPDFRAGRPPDSDGVLGDVFDQDFDPSLVAPDDVDNSSDPGDPTKELCNPTQSLKLEENGLVQNYGNTAVFRFENIELPRVTPPSRFPALAQNPDATYVLLTDGVPDDHYNPDFDWSRHLPSIVPLDRRSHDKALDLIFKFFTSWCLRVVPALFLRDMYRALSMPAANPVPKTPHYSPMLHNALVALGLAFLDDPNLRDLKSRQYFANKAKSYVETECAKPNLSVVNALSILASFHSSQGDQTLGYLYFGMSAQMAQALGLNVDCSEWVKLGVMDESDILDRRWTYWTTFTQDVCWSLYVGREFCVAAPPINTEMFRAVSMPLVDLDFDQMPWNHPAAKLEPQPNYLTKTFEATCELLMIARRIMEVVNSLDKSRSRPFAIDEVISEIDLNLNTWKGRLSPELDITVKSRPTATPHKLMLHLSYWWLFILLHRPFFQRKSRQIHSTDREIDHVKLCRRASENIMELLATWRSLYTLRYCPITLIQCVFSAGTVYLLTSVQASSGTRVAQKDLRHSMEQQTRVLQYLQEIGKSWQCATNIAGIMKSLMHEQLKPLLERKTIPISASHSGALFLSEYGDDDDEGSLTGRVRRRSSLTKPKTRRLGVHSRDHSVHLTSAQPSPSSISVSLSPVITISHPHQDLSATYAPSSSPARSAPIAIQRSANNRESSLSSTSPSSFTDPWAFRSHIPVTSADSPSQAFASPMYSPSSLSGSAPSQPAFGHRDTSSGSLTTAPHQHLQQYAAYLTSPMPTHAPAPLDELAFAGSGHTTSHVFTTLDGAFGHALPVPAGTDMSAFRGMPGGQTLPQAPSVVGVSFAAFAPEPAFAFEDPAARFTHEFVEYSAPAGAGPGYEDYAAGDMDANMDDGAQWDAWDGSLEF